MVVPLKFLITSFFTGCLTIPLLRSPFCVVIFEALCCCEFSDSISEDVLEILHWIMWINSHLNVIKGINSRKRKIFSFGLGFQLKRKSCGESEILSSSKLELSYNSRGKNWISVFTTEGNRLCQRRKKWGHKRLKTTKRKHAEDCSSCGDCWKQRKKMSQDSQVETLCVWKVKLKKDLDQFQREFGLVYVSYWKTLKRRDRHGWGHQLKRGQYWREEVVYQWHTDFIISFESREFAVIKPFHFFRTGWKNKSMCTIRPRRKNCIVKDITEARTHGSLWMVPLVLRASKSVFSKISKIDQ